MYVIWPHCHWLHLMIVCPRRRQPRAPSPPPTQHPDEPVLHRYIAARLWVRGGFAAMAVVASESRVDGIACEHGSSARAHALSLNAACSHCLGIRFQLQLLKLKCPRAHCKKCPASVRKANPFLVPQNVRLLALPPARPPAPTLFLKITLTTLILARPQMISRVPRKQPFN